MIDSRDSASEVRTGESTAEPWKRPRLLGYQETLRGLGGVVAPLLTGFSLATIAVLVTASDKPALADWAEAALAASVASLLLSMQCAFLALARNPSPGEIMVWQPETRVSEQALEQARIQQAADFDAMSRLWRLTAPTYDLGVVTFLAGLLLLLIPHQWSPGRVAAVVIASVALVGELWWTVANRTSGVPHPVVRRRDTPPGSPIAPLSQVGSASVLDPARREAAGLESDPGSSG